MEHNEKKPVPVNPTPDSDEIDLIALAKTVWDGRRTIIKAIVVASVIGVFVALFSAKQYTASTTVVPNMGQSGNRLGGLSSLAAMAGFNLDMSTGGETLSPMVYPKIATSVEYQLELMNTPFTFSNVDKPVSLYEYYTNIYKPGFMSVVKKYTLGLPGVILKAIRGKQNQVSAPEDLKGPISLTGKQEAIRKMIASSVSVNLDAKNGYITIQASSSEPLLTAQIAQQARELLQKYITQLKIEKATAKFEFIKNLYQEKKSEFEKAQNRLARYRDQNKNVSSALALTDQEKLQGEYTIALNVYNEVAKQLEQAKIQVKEETPVFAVLEPVMVPIEKTKPKRSMILAIWIFLGIITGVGIVFGKGFLKTIQSKWNEES